MDVSIIIPNYKSERHLSRCIQALQSRSDGSLFEIIIINNDTAPITSILPIENIRLIENGINEGFAKACNRGAKIAKGEILFFLNPDTELIKGNIKDLLAALENKSVGIVAPQLTIPSGEIQKWSAGYEINLCNTIKNNLGFVRSKNLWEQNNIIEADWVSGAAFLIKKTLFDEISGFDENFFMYFEDVDLCKRLLTLKKKILILPSVQVLHLGGQSADNNNVQKKQYYTSQDYYFKKHFGFFQFLFLSILRNTLLFSKKTFTESGIYCLLLVLFALLPFQFALNPAKGFDLAIIRIIIPILFLSWIFLKIKNKEPFFIQSKTTYLLSAFIFLASFSVLFSQNIFWSLRKLFFLATLIPLYFITVSIFDTTSKKRKAMLALVSGGAILALIALVQFFSQFVFGIDKTYLFLAKYITPFFLGNSFSASVLAYPSWLVNAGGTTCMRAFAIFPDPHMLSYYLGMLIPWAIALWATSKTHRVWLFVSLILLIIADILTFTRGGYIALIVGAITVLPLVSKKTAMKIIVGAIFILFLFTVAPHNPVTGRLVSSFDVQEGSNKARISNWQQAISIISEHPFGVGIGAYSLAVKPSATYREPIYAHNLYLDIAAELGIITALIFIAILLTTFLSFWKISKKQPFFIAGVASISIFSAHSLVENPLYSVHVLPLFLIIIALSASNYLYEKTNNIA